MVAVASGCEKYQQLFHRHGVPFVRHLLAGFPQQTITAVFAAKTLGVSRRRFYQLYRDYLHACAQRQANQWKPRPSGGNHLKPWPEPVQALLRKKLSTRPPASYSFAASECLRLCNFQMARAQVRRWAIKNHLARPLLPKPVPAALRR